MPFVHRMQSLMVCVCTTLPPTHHDDQLYTCDVQATCCYVSRHKNWKPPAPKPCQCLLSHLLCKVTMQRLGTHTAHVGST